MRSDIFMPLKWQNKKQKNQFGNICMKCAAKHQFTKMCHMVHDAIACLIRSSLIFQLLHSFIHSFNYYGTTSIIRPSNWSRNGQYRSVGEQSKVERPSNKYEQTVSTKSRSIKSYAILCIFEDAKIRREGQWFKNSKSLNYNNVYYDTIILHNQQEKFKAVFIHWHIDIQCQLNLQLCEYSHSCEYSIILPNINWFKTKLSHKRNHNKHKYHIMYY